MEPDQSANRVPGRSERELAAQPLAAEASCSADDEKDDSRDVTQA